jgi:hypothetical protein
VVVAFDAGLGEFAERVDNAIGCTIAEQVIKEVPDVTRQARDFTGATSAQRAGTVVKWRN